MYDISIHVLNNAQLYNVCSKLYVNSPYVYQIMYEAYCSPVAMQFVLKMY